MLHGICQRRPGDLGADVLARYGAVREIIVFAVLNGIGLLIQDATVGFNYYLLHLGHDRLAGLVALNAGIALATLFRFWSYRRFVWVTSREDS
jgi:hypothetical protein